MKRTFSDAIRGARVNGAVDMRKIEENSWIGRGGGRHDVTEGPCYCGAWHLEGETKHLPEEE